MSIAESMQNSKTPDPGVVAMLPLNSLTGGIYRHVVVYLLFWLMVAMLATATAMVATGGGPPGMWLQAFIPIAIYWYLWAAATPLVYRVVARLSWSGTEALWSILAHAGILLTVTMAGPLVFFGGETGQWLATPQARAYHGMNVPTYIFIVIGCMLLSYGRAKRIQERISNQMAIRTARLETELANARLNALRMEVNPHFLFNALNSIASMIETESKHDAYRAMEQLGQLLRYTLERSKNALVTLNDELESVRRYIDIEKIRFDDNLRYQEDIDANSRALLIPSLILLPLIENAIKHAVSKSCRPVRVTVSSQLAEGKVCLIVSDDGPDAPTTRSAWRGGLGLDNLRERLTLQYGGDQYELSLAGTEVGTRVSIIIPVIEAS